MCPWEVMRSCQTYTVLCQQHVLRLDKLTKRPGDTCLGPQTAQVTRPYSEREKGGETESLRHHLTNPKIPFLSQTEQCPRDKWETPAKKSCWLILPAGHSLLWTT